jgi:uncharacterized protein (DUF885 family)
MKIEDVKKDFVTYIDNLDKNLKEEEARLFNIKKEYTSLDDNKKILADDIVLLEKIKTELNDKNTAMLDRHSRVVERENQCERREKALDEDEMDYRKRFDEISTLSSNACEEMKKAMQKMQEANLPIQKHVERLQEIINKKGKDTNLLEEIIKLSK